ncbi:MAG: hypothetical protein B6247_31050 [Candidatus Parabeggiatoa sp. nov. 2]|nr:MAG: hypothetical protein B6247_31050 [Beggiatoa sp. 4572_84]
MSKPQKLGAILTLETARIFFSTKNGATNIGRISFRQRTRLANNPRQLRAMLTLETARIFYRQKTRPQISAFKPFDKGLD